MSADVHTLTVPKWGLSMTEGRVVEWLVQEGAEVAAGDELAELESEKINGAVEAPAAGVLRRQVATVGQGIPVGGLLAVIAPADVPDAEIDRIVAEFQATFVPPAEEGAEEQGPETVTVGGRTLRYLRSGEDLEPLVLIHGFGGDLNNWLFCMEPLAAARAVYALDLPGHGGSAKDVGDGDAQTLAGMVLGFMDELGLERAHLAGHSLGGLVAIEIARRAPERVASLTLVASAGLGEEIDAEYVEGFIDARTRRELRPVLERLFADPALVTRQLVDDVLQNKRIDGVEPALRAIAARLHEGGRQRQVVAGELEQLDVPLLVVWGREDRIIPAAHAEAAPAGATVTVLDGVGHSPHMEAANEFNRMVEGFLAKAVAA